MIRHQTGLQRGLRRLRTSAVQACPLLFLVAGGCNALNTTSKDEIDVDKKGVSSSFHSSVNANECGADGLSSVACSSFIYPYPASGVVIGQGWNSFSEQGTSALCVDVDIVTLERSSFRQHVEQLLSSYSLATKMTTSVSASYKGVGAQGSGKFSSSRDLTINTDDQNFLFSFESAIGSTFAAPPGSVGAGQFEFSESAQKALSAAGPSEASRQMVAAALSRPPKNVGSAISLTQEARALLDRDKEAFRRVCGDGFVAAIHRGSKVDLVLSQQSRSDKERKSLSASLSGSGYGFSGSASYTRSSERLKSTDALSYRVMQEGGVPLGPKSLDSAKSGEFFDVSLILPQTESLLQNPAAFRVTIIPYASIAPDAALSIRSPVKLFTFGDYYLALRDLYDVLEDLIAAERSGTNRGPNPPFEPRLIAVYGGLTFLEALQDQIQADLGILEIAIDGCYRGKNDCTVSDAMKHVKREVEAQEKGINASFAQFKAEGGNKSLTDGDFLRQLSAFKSEVDRYQTLISDNGEIDDDFFLAFYVYAAAIPLPLAAYNESSAFATIKQLAIPAGADENAKATAIKSLKLELGEAIIQFRLEPWKRFFCNEQVVSPLCVSEGSLRALVEAANYRIESDTFRIIPPPAPRGRGRNCRGLRKVGNRHCW